MAQPSRVRLEDIAATVPLEPGQSAAVVLAVAARLQRWAAARNPSELIVPSLADIALNRGGNAWWSRGRTVAQPLAPRALGALLSELLHHSPERTPAGLLYIVSRATEPGHVAPFATLQEFVAALARHAPDRRDLALDGLLAQFFMASAGLPPLNEHSTISDVRRRRRAGGVALASISRDTGIPLSLLRELEWGVYVNWDLAYARPSLEAYAERAGLDAPAVVAVVMNEQTETGLVPVTPEPIGASHALGPDRRHLLLPFALAAAVAGVLAVTTPEESGGVRAEAVTAPVRPVRPAVHEVVRDNTPEEQPEAPAVLPDSGAAAESTQPARARTSSRIRQPAKLIPGADRTGATPARPGAKGRLVRLARAITGDGRHKVEPFPRPQ